MGAKRFSQRRAGLPEDVTAADALRMAGGVCFACGHSSRLLCAAVANGRWRAFCVRCPVPLAEGA